MKNENLNDGLNWTFWCIAILYLSVLFFWRDNWPLITLSVVGMIVLSLYNILFVSRIGSQTSLFKMTKHKYLAITNAKMFRVVGPNVVVSVIALLQSELSLMWLSVVFSLYVLTFIRISIHNR